jgi:hypothetical protein
LSGNEARSSVLSPEYPIMTNRSLTEQDCGIMVLDVRLMDLALDRAAQLYVPVAAESLG